MSVESYKNVLLLLLLFQRFKAVLTQRLDMIQKYWNTTDHLVRTSGNGDPMHGVCIPDRIPRAWQQQR